MSILGLIFQRLNIVGVFRELGTTEQRRDTLIALASTQLLVQMASLPVVLTIPTVADYFDVGVSKAAWIVIIRLLMLGSTVFLAARMGEKYGHIRVYFIGAIIVSLASAMASTALTLNQLIFWSGLVGIGAGMIAANSNAILSMVFGETERGRAFAIPITAARFGTFLGLGLFGVFLQYLSWRLVFLTSLPVGLLAIKLNYPLLKYQYQQAREAAGKITIDYLGAILLTATLGVFILSGMHIHEGSESFTSAEAVDYHVPMHLLFLSLLVLFFVMQRRTTEPFLDFRYFRQKCFSMALFSNTTFHLSMVAVFTLIPIVVEDGLGKGPTVVTLVLLPNQVIGLFLPVISGWVFDRYNPRWLRPGSLMFIALGFVLLGLFAADVPIWGLPLLLFPSSFGSALFNSPNNALVMNTLPENRSFASGMLETSRQMGHTLGATVGATVLGLALPVAIELMPATEAQSYYREGFQYAALAVVWIMIAGSIVALFQKVPTGGRRRGPEPAPSPGGDA